MRAAEEPSPSALALEYHLILTHPSLHLVTVQISAGNVSGEFIDFVMPAWAPGRYAIYDFAKNVQEFEAKGASGSRCHGAVSTSRPGEWRSGKPGERKGALPRFRQRPQRLLFPV